MDLFQGTHLKIAPRLPLLRENREMPTVTKGIRDLPKGSSKTPRKMDGKTRTNIGKMT